MMKIKNIVIRTWMIESAVVLLTLITPMLFIDFSWRELVGVLAVFFTFKQTQIGDRMSERQAQQENPDVHCYKWFYRHFVIKEILWITFFLMIGSYSALIGCGIFILYPIWRKLYRKYKPFTK